jgi:hypothetical protein
LEALPKLRKDAQNRAEEDGPLTEVDLHGAFDEHVAALLRRACEDVRALLESKLRALTAEDFEAGPHLSTVPINPDQLIYVCDVHWDDSSGSRAKQLKMFLDKERSIRSSFLVLVQVPT